MQLDIRVLIERFAAVFADLQDKMPWEITNDLAEILNSRMPHLGKEYSVKDGVAIHSTAVIEQNVVLKGPIIIGKDCFVGANAYLRGPVFLDEAVSIGAGCEIKQSIIFSSTAVAHFNYVGNSIVGSDVNFEAGSVAANHYNERKDKIIAVLHEGKVINTSSKKFGSLIGDHSRIGANAVLSPGTILPKHSIVKRLELIEQVK
jgi:NDP-sugar pyrophosphorylase family protein